MKKERKAKEELEQAKKREAEAERLAALERRRRQRAYLLTASAFLMFLLAAGMGFWAMRERRTANLNQVEAEKERNNAQVLLKQFQQAEAERVLVEVNDRLSRAETLRDKGYLDNYRAILKEAELTLEKYPNNPVLQTKLKELKN